MINWSITHRSDHKSLRNILFVWFFLVSVFLFLIIQGLWLAKWSRRNLDEWKGDVTTKTRFGMIPYSFFLKPQKRFERNLQDPPKESLWTKKKTGENVYGRITAALIKEESENGVWVRRRGVSVTACRGEGLVALGWFVAVY